VELERELDAGPFAEWRARLLDALATGGAMDVPCGTCTACCRSGFFIHIEPDEVATLRRIPKALRFPAPGRPAGHVVLGYDEHGRCPMLVDDRCSIYEDRPRTCRQFDCRVLAATDLVDDDKPLVSAQAARWRFSHPTDRDRAQHDAVRAVAVAVSTRGGSASGPVVQVALAAVREA
jgi:hypothetical protein